MHFLHTETIKTHIVCTYMHSRLWRHAHINAHFLGVGFKPTSPDILIYMNAKCVSQFQTAIESHQTIELYLCGSKDCLICCYYFVVAFVCTAAAVIVVAVVVFKHEKKKCKTVASLFTLGDFSSHLVGTPYGYSSHIHNFSMESTATQKLLRLECSVICLEMHKIYSK